MSCCVNRGVKLKMDHLLKSTQDLFKITKTERDIENFVKMNKRNIALIISKLQTNLSVGEKSKLENLLSIFKAYNVQIRKQRINQFGSGLATTSHTAAAAATPSSSNHNNNSEEAEQNVVWKKVRFF